MSCNNCGKPNGQFQCVECNSFTCRKCASIQCDTCGGGIGCGCCVKECEDCSKDICGRCTYDCDVGGGNCDRLSCEECISMVDYCIRCNASLAQVFYACSLCSPHLDEEITCEDCLSLENYTASMAEYQGMWLAEVRNHLVLKTCFNVLRQFATASKLIPGHAGYKRLRDEVISRGAFARRSARLALK